MIVYGTKGVSIQTGKVRNITCPHCSNNVEMNYSVFGRYAHVYWIPFFPIGREKILECNSCKSSYHLKDLPEPIKQKFQHDQDRNPAKTPVTHFSFLFVIGILFAIGAFFSFKEDSDTIDFGKNPKIGDVFYETLPNGHYSTSKISKITKDSIFVLQNNKESFEKKDVSSQSADAINFVNPWQFSKKKYAEMVKNGDSIYKIIRD